MGGWHQIHLIARVTPYGQPPSETRYRCIAALRDDECEGYLPLKGAARFITLIKQKGNAEIIREEIQSIHGLYGTFRIPPKLPEVPCPFIHFLMNSAWTDLSEPDQPNYYAAASVLPASMGTTERTGDDPDDGTTIIDVTNPESPAYCLVFTQPHKERSNEDRSNVTLMTPLPATRYLRVYYREPHNSSSTFDADVKFEEEWVLPALRPFESVPMITIDMLAEAWPGEYVPDPSGLSPEPKELRPTSVHILPSLVDLTFVPALIHALQIGETDRLDPVMWLPGNASKIKEALRARNPFSAADFALLTKVIPVMQTKSIDLSHFSLTGEQVIKLLSAREDVNALNLSHMQHMTANILRELIPILPKLRRLVILHTIPDADILSLLIESPELFYRIDSFIHFAFLRPLDQAAFPPAFSHVIAYEREISMVSLPYFTSDQLVQGLTDYFDIPGSQDRFVTPALLLLLMYGSAVREPGRSWDERIVPFIPGRECKMFNEREGWFLAWLVPRDYSIYRYAFAKFDSQAMEECEQRINELRSLSSHGGQARPVGGGDANSSTTNVSLSDENIRVKENAIRSEYIDREFRIFDLKSFFKELVKEGRPAPCPEALTNLLNLFASFGWPRGLFVMTQVELRSFLVDVKGHQNHSSGQPNPGELSD